MHCFCLHFRILSLLWGPINKFIEEMAINTKVYRILSMLKNGLIQVMNVADLNENSILKRLISRKWCHFYDKFFTQII